MIEVYVEYTLVTYASGREYFKYRTFNVKGHADNLGGTKGIKCCAGVTACLVGLTRLLGQGENYSYELKSGEFNFFQHGDCSNTEINHYMNLILCQLFDIYQMYPSFFSKFETVRLGHERAYQNGKSKNKSK